MVLISDGVSSDFKMKWNFFILFYIVLVGFQIPLINSFNLDAKFPLFVANPRRQGDLYFGYAVDYHVDSSESWVIVGAPNSGIDGEVFKCQKNVADTTLKYGPCQTVQLNKRNSPKVKQMLGSTVLIGNQRELLCCAPKFSHTTTPVGSNIDSYNIIGACYFIEDFTDPASTTFQYLPCYNNLGNGNGHKLSFCQAGFSATFLKENEMVLLGAVGSYYNQGAILLLNGTDVDYNHPSIHTIELKPQIPDDWTGNSVDYYRQSFDNNYMGYSIAVGKSYKGKTLIATSAPRRMGFDLLGSVVVYDEQLRNALVNFTGTQIGEYFGHGLAFIDVNGDNLDDLIIGSPLYTDNTYRYPEIGRIYIFYQQDSSSTKTGVSFSDPFIINGNATLGRFGNVITSMGDVNDDSYQDFLVSAPYERSETSNEQYGALYVFNGGRGGVSKNPSQIIHGANLEARIAGSNIRGLGFSIKGGKDIDDNGYPDIVAGAYLSDSAVVIRARPVVKLLVNNMLHPAKVDLETPKCITQNGVKAVCFIVHSCFSYDGKNLPSSIEFSYSYNADSSLKDDDKRTYFTDSSARSMTLTASSAVKCVNETVYLKNEIKDKLTPISVTLSYWLNEKNVPVEPVLDIFNSTSSVAVAEITKNCGSDNICTPQLEVSSEVVQPSKVIIGRYAEILISSVVINRKERAYQTLLVVQYPTSVSYINAMEEGGSPIHCIAVNSTVVCEVGNPLLENHQVRVNLRFGTRVLQGDVSRLTFEILANCSNEKTYVSLPVQNYVDVGVEANIQIFNASLPEIVPLDKLSKEVNASGAFAVSHTYEITNAGPSSFSSAKVQVLWPLTLESGKLLFGLDEVITVGPVQCSAAHVVNETKNLTKKLAPLHLSESKYGEEEGNRKVNYYNCQSRTKQCSEIICTVNGMQPKEDILITFKGKLRVEPLSAAGVADSIVTSSLVFEILSYPYEISADTERTLTTSEVSTAALYPQTSPPASLDWWVIAVAVAGGVIFLLLIILILWKCGFFKRKRIPTEEELDQQQQLYQAELVEKEQEGLD